GRSLRSPPREITPNADFPQIASSLGRKKEPFRGRIDFWNLYPVPDRCRIRTEKSGEPAPSVVVPGSASPTAWRKRSQMATGNLTQDQATSERDLLGTYLAEIGRVPLLTAEEEVELAKRIEAGLFAEYLLDSALTEPRIGDATDEELERIAISGRRAKDEFIKANLRLVVAVARKYAGRGMPLIDLVQEGNVGLVRAVEKFDYRRGYK